MFNTLLALAAGALLGLAIVLLIEYLDDTVKTPDQVRDLTGLATLGNVILLEGAGPDQRLVSRMATKSLGAEAYRVLRTNLQFSALDRPLQTIVCTSAAPGEGKSTTITNLAVVMAQNDRRIILVDADLRRPSLHKILKLPNSVGLSTALLDRGRDPAAYLQETEIDNLRVMTTGPIPPNPAEMLNSARMHEMIEILKTEADVVLFDTPPVLAVADTSILASQVDGTLLVVWANRTRGELLAQAVDRLGSLGIQPLGVVLNKLTQRRSGYYYSNYYYYTSGDSGDGASGASNRLSTRRRRRSPSQPNPEQAA
jgi:non-specific protein-tyrosine kinase